MGFEWPQWALDALRGIEPQEVVQALDAKHRLPRPARSATGSTCWTRTERPLVMAVRRTDPWTWLIIGAREMCLQERTEFARWEEAQDG